MKIFNLFGKLWFMCGSIKNIKIEPKKVNYDIKLEVY